MKEEDLKRLGNQRIKLILRGDFIYMGEVLSLNEDALTLRDKHGDVIAIALDEIKIAKAITSNSGVTLTSPRRCEVELCKGPVEQEDRDIWICSWCGASYSTNGARRLSIYQPKGEGR